MALGNIANYSNEWTGQVYRPPVDHHSVRIMGKRGPDFAHSVINENLQVYPVGPLVSYPKPALEKGVKLFKSPQGFFAEYLKNKKAEENPKKGERKPADEPMAEPVDEDAKDVDEEEDIGEDVRKRIEESFLKIKDRKYEIKPNVINAEYCINRLRREGEDFEMDCVYADVSQYMVYSEKQARIRYMVELTMV